MGVNKLFRAANFACRNFMADHPNTDPSERIWLISERGYDAQDNGAAFYEWLTYSHPEIHAIYVIAPSDRGYARIHALGDTVTPGSKRHFELMYQAEALISTHAFGYTPDMVIYNHLARVGLFNPNGVSVFLQHGVLDKKTEWLSYKNFRPDLFEASTPMESELIRNYNHQPDSAIMCSGQCRYDMLYHSAPKKQILIFPTWRKWLTGVSPLAFEASQYHHMWEQLIQSDVWGALPADWRVVFRLHPEAQKHTPCFQSKRVIVDDASDIGELIRDSAAVLTDYSSVYFDFVYRDLPVAFFQFDRDRFATEHYDGLAVRASDYGACAEAPDQAVSALLERMRAVFGSALDISAKPAIRTSAQCFYHVDDHNCERTYDAIESKIAQKSGRNARPE